MRSAVTLAVALGLALSACVLAPVSRTYYAPNPEDGTPTRSRSCGYHRAADDTLQREVQGLTLSITPALQDQALTSVHVSIRRTDAALTLEPSRLVLQDEQGRLLPLPSKVTVDESARYFSRTVTYAFASAPAPAELSVSFQPGFLQIDGRPVELRPFRYRKVTRLDVYYSSINC